MDKGLEAEEEAGEEQLQSEITTKTDRDISTNTCSKESSKLSEVQKPDYIHVRARRGQATDSHSLAERVCILRIGCMKEFSSKFV